MATDTCIVHSSDIAAEEFRRDERIDRAENLPSMAQMTAREFTPLGRRAAPARTGRPADVLAWIDRQDRMRFEDAAGNEARELLGRCTAAANMTGGDHRSVDHRDDVAAELVARNLGTMPDLSKLCGQALNLYRAIDRRAADLRAADLQAHAERAATPAGTGTDAESLAERDSLRAIAAIDAERMAAHLARKLGFRAASMPDATVWSAMYRVARSGATDAQLATERGVSIDTFQRTANRGAAEVRAAFPAAELLRALGLGRNIAAHRPGMSPSRTLADALHLVGGEDHTGEARSRTRCLAEPGERARDAILRAAPAPDVAERECEPTAEPIDRTRPDVRREAFRWTRREYRARMLSVGQGAALAAEQDRAPRRAEQTSDLAAALGRN